MNLTKEKVEEVMNEAWRKFTWDYPTVTSNKFIPRFLAFVSNPKSMKEVFVNAFYKGWVQSVQQLSDEHQEFVELEELYRDTCKDIYALTGKLDSAAEALEKAQHSLKIGVDPGIVRARIIDAMNEIKPAPATITQAELDALPKGNDDKPAPATGFTPNEFHKTTSELQPAPATGEWTAETVGDLGLQLNDYQREELAKAINAIIACAVAGGRVALSAKQQELELWRIRAIKQGKRLAAAVEAMRAVRPYLHPGPVPGYIIKDFDAALAKIGEGK